MRKDFANEPHELKPGYHLLCMGLGGWVVLESGSKESLAKRMIAEETNTTLINFKHKIVEVKRGDKVFAV